MKRRARTDATHRAIFDAAKQLGREVIETHQLGGGCPDGFVHLGGFAWLAVEAKTSRGTLTPDQQVTHQGGHIAIVRSVEDLLQLLGIPR